jgi:hypothetical protein
VSGLQLLLTGGAKAGRAGGSNDGGGCAKDPYMNAWTYYPGNPAGKRFVVDPVNGQSVPRLYHSVALVLPSGELVSTGGDQGVANGPTCDAPMMYGYKVDAFTFPANVNAMQRGARGVITRAPAKVGRGPQQSQWKDVLCISCAAVMPRTCERWCPGE